MDRVAPERSEKFMVPPRLEYWMVILNLKSVASVKRTRLAANLFVDVITDRVYSDIEIFSSNFIRTRLFFFFFFFYEISKRNFSILDEKRYISKKFNQVISRKFSLAAHSPFRSEFLHFSKYTRLDATSYVSTPAHSPSVR